MYIYIYIKGRSGILGQLHYRAAVSVMSEPVWSTSPATAATVISTTCLISTVSQLHGVTVIGTLVQEHCASSSAVTPNFVIQCREICYVVKLQVENRSFLVTVSYTYRNASANGTLRLVRCVSSKYTHHKITLSVQYLLDDNYFFLSHSRCTFDCDDDVN
jgi:hypothetical protein